MTFQTIKNCAGDYIRTDGTFSVSVKHYDHLMAWIAAAEWDRQLYTDPVATMREAILNADNMLQQKSGK